MAYVSKRAAELVRGDITPSYEVKSNPTRLEDGSLELTTYGHNTERLEIIRLDPDQAIFVSDEQRSGESSLNLGGAA